jgi:hypothetical protein
MIIQPKWAVILLTSISSAVGILLISVVLLSIIKLIIDIVQLTD